MSRSSEEDLFLSECATMARVLKAHHRFEEAEKAERRAIRVGLQIDEPVAEPEEEENKDLFPQDFAWERMENAMAEILRHWRSEMESHYPPLHALVVPSECQKVEYASLREKHGGDFVSGFSGLALITANEAMLWTSDSFFQDIRYFSDAWTRMKKGEDPDIEVWISNNLPQDANIGLDSWCVSVDTVNRWNTVLAEKNQMLFQISTDLLDPSEMSPMGFYDLDVAGRSISDKLMELRAILKKESVGALAVGALDEVAWLYNIRGPDISYCPFVHAFTIVTRNSSTLYVEKKKVSDEAITYLERIGVEVQELNDVISDISQPSWYTGNKVWMDPATCCYALYYQLDAEKVMLQPSPLKSLVG